MTIPARIKVGPLTYSVLTDADAIKAASDSAEIEKGSEWSAFSDHDKLIVGINPDNPVNCQQRDLLHELLHCCLRLSGVWPNQYARLVARAKHKDGGYTVEEFVVAAAAGPLLGVLRDNPDLAKWLAS